MSATVKIYIEILFLQLPLYALIVGCAYGSWLEFNRRHYLIAIFLAGIAVLPGATYAYSFAASRFVAPAARRAEVASWPRVKITQDNKPNTFLTTWQNSGGSIAKALVQLDRFEKAYGLVADDWYAFERIQGQVCPQSQHHPLDHARQNETRETTPCVSVKKLGRYLMPQISEPHLRLLIDGTAPSHHRSASGTTGRTLELRLVSKEASQLVSFWEVAYFDVPVFPPILVNGEKGWVREPFGTNRMPPPDPLKFVLDAIGDA
ncbi:hypothetical protein AB7M16_004211 [Bradyrhizobium sp. USDA 372]